MIKKKKNIEIKARLDEKRFIEIENKLCYENFIEESVTIIFQEDTFFNCDRGRLKLRTFGNSTEGSLISYIREDSKDKPRVSNYQIYQTQCAELLKDTLEMTCGIKGVLKKTRKLCLVGQTRIHLDYIEDLGYFLEFEVVLKKKQSEEDGIKVAEWFMKKFDITEKDLIDVAYIDLLLLNKK